MRRNGGFTLVEIMIVVAVIALIAVIAIPSFMRARQKARASRFINDLRLASGAFQLYASEHNQLPPPAPRSILPAGMEGYMGTLDWTAPTPIGGTWRWENDVHDLAGFITVRDPNASKEEMEEIDSQIDDGDLSTGNFIYKANRYAFAVEN